MVASKIAETRLKLALYFIKDLRVFSEVESEGFLGLVHALNPSFEVPSRRTVGRWISDLYEQTSIEVSRRAKSILWCAATLDGWTSLATEGYLGITVHFIDDNWEMKGLTLGCIPVPGSTSHTADHIASVLLEELDRYNLRNTTTAVVHDNGSNMVAMNLPFTSIRCIAHTLQLAVKAGLAVPEVVHVVTRIRQMVFFLSS